jgi:hypothetical protein
MILLMPLATLCGCQGPWLEKTGDAVPVVRAPEMEESGIKIPGTDFSELNPRHAISATIYIPHRQVYILSLDGTSGEDRANTCDGLKRRLSNKHLAARRAVLLSVGGELKKFPEDGFNTSPIWDDQPDWSALSGPVSKIDMTAAVKRAYEILEAANDRPKEKAGITIIFTGDVPEAAAEFVEEKRKNGSDVHVSFEHFMDLRHVDQKNIDRIIAAMRVPTPR